MTIDQKKRFSKPLKLVLTVGASIFFSEALVMLFISTIPEMSRFTEAIVDAALLSVFVFPLLYVFLFRPMLRYIDGQAETEGELKASKIELERRLVELEQTHRALEESEDQYKVLFNNNPNPMWIYDLETLRFLLVNEAAVIVYGYSRAEFLSMTIKEIRPSEDVPALLENVAHVTEGLDEAGVWRHLRKDGSVILVEITSHTIEFNGRRGEVVLAYDVTRRKSAEDELQRHKNMLEAIVEERTSEVQQANEELSIRAAALEQKNRDIALLSQMNSLHQVCNTSEEAYAVVTSSAQQLFPDDAGMLMITNVDNGLLECVAVWGLLEKAAGGLTVDDCWALRRGQGHVFRREGIDLRCNHAGEAGPYICVPLVAHGTTMGVFHLRVSLPFDSPYFEEAMNDRQQLSQTVAEQVSISLSNIRLRETLKSMSIHDPLTGLFNRRYMEEFFRREIHVANRKGTQVGVIMLDIDHFKRFNDTLGHEAGDALLKELAKFLRKYCRDSDVVCRYGGEEFVIVMPEASLDVATGRAEALRESVKLLRLDYEGMRSAGSISISLGVAVFPEHGVSIERVLRSADDAMYRAKRGGRDRVCVAE